MTERQIRERSAELLQAVRPGRGRPCHPCVPPCYAVVLCGRRPPLLTDLHRSLAAIAVAPGQNDNVVLPRRATARPSRTRSASTKSPGAHVPDPAVRLDPRSGGGPSRCEGRAPARRSRRRARRRARLAWGESVIKC
jgi:hypothetical protein